MKTHVFGIVAITALIVTCTLLPFLPGSYDPAAVPLSVSLQFVALASLSLVPAGTLLLASRSAGRLGAHHRVVVGFALVAVSLTWVAACLAAFLFSTVLSVFVAAAGVCVMVVVVHRWRRGLEPFRGNVAIYFLGVPIATVALQYALIPRSIESSRSRAIRNSGELIRDIERYHAVNGRYPVSLLSMYPDYKPLVIGIAKYHYEANGDSYNVFFEQLAYRFGTREIVMYNPRDEHQATSHAMDILQYPPDLLNRARGYYARHDLPDPHWKYFWFD